MPRVRSRNRDRPLRFQGTPGFVFRTLTLTEDPHPLSAETFDTSGNRSDQSQELLVTVDWTDPAQPIEVALARSSDTGTVGDGSPTQDINFPDGVVVTAGDTVQLTSFTITCPAS